MAYDYQKMKDTVIASSSIDECRAAGAIPPVPRCAPDQNYVFISYSHKDYKSVYCDLLDLHAAGVRFWYDNDLTPGVNWDEEVKQHIISPQCAGVIFFLSKNLLLSPSVAKEIGYTRELSSDDTGEQIGKNYFCVNLEGNKTPTEISFEIIQTHTMDILRAMQIDLSKLAMIASAFSDKSTFIPKFKPEYSLHMATVLRTLETRYNVTSVPDGEEEDAPAYVGEPSDTEEPDTDGETFEDEEVYVDGEEVYEDGEECEDEEFDSASEEDSDDDPRTDDLFTSDATANTRITVYSKVTFADGSIYDGEWVDGEKDGKGVLTLPNGDFYDGEWSRDKKQGHGKERIAGSTYEGEFAEGMRHGHGKSTWSDGSTFVGSYSYGLRDGDGLYTDADGNRTHQFWRHGRLVGETLIPEGMEYTLPSEAENSTESDGITDIPDVPDIPDEPSQSVRITVYSKVTFADGSIYDGEWVDGEKDGKGVLTFPNGDFYDGEWSRDKKQGYGKEKIASSTYEGEFAEGMRHGHGKSTWSDGSTFVGSYSYGLRDGDGIYTDSFGRRFGEVWKCGRKISETPLSR